MSKLDETSSNKWIEHDGGSCPVDTDRGFEVQFSDETVSRAGGDWNWGLNGRNNTIVFYRYLDTPTKGTNTDKVELVDKLFDSEVVSNLTLLDLIESYDCIDKRENDVDWDTKDALRKVIHYYSTEDQYDEFKEDRGL